MRRRLIASSISNLHTAISTLADLLEENHQPRRATQTVTAALQLKHKAPKPTSVTKRLPGHTRISNQERKIIIAANGCVFCRKYGHLTSDCPDLQVLKDARTARDAQAQEQTEADKRDRYAPAPELPFTEVKPRRKAHRAKKPQ